MLLQTVAYEPPQHISSLRGTTWRLLAPATLAYNLCTHLESLSAHRI